MFGVKATPVPGSSLVDQTYYKLVGGGSAEDVATRVIHYLRTGEYK